MGSKEKSGSAKEESVFSGIISAIRDRVVSQVSRALKSVVEGAQNRIYEVEKNLLKRAFAFALLFLGLVFVLVGFALLLAQYSNMGLGLSFFITGVLVVFFSLVFEAFAKK